MLVFFSTPSNRGPGLYALKKLDSGDQTLGYLALLKTMFSNHMLVEYPSISCILAE